MAEQLLYTFLIPVVVLLLTGIWSSLSKNIEVDNYDRVYLASLVGAAMSAIWLVWS